MSPACGEADATAGQEDGGEPRASSGTERWVRGLPEPPAGSNSLPHLHCHPVGPVLGSRPWDREKDTSWPRSLWLLATVGSPQRRESRHLLGASDTCWFRHRCHSPLTPSEPDPRRARVGRALGRRPPGHGGRRGSGESPPCPLAFLGHEPIGAGAWEHPAGSPEARVRVACGDTADPTPAIGGPRQHQGPQTHGDVPGRLGWRDSGKGSLPHLLLCGRGAA